MQLFLSTRQRGRGVLSQRFKLTHNQIRRDVEKAPSHIDGDPSREKWVIRSLLESYAKEKGYTLGARTDLVIEGLMKRREKFGEYYCPCRIPRGEPGEVEWMICPCTKMHEEVQVGGKCTCSLFER